MIDAPPLLYADGGKQHALQGRRIGSEAEITLFEARKTYLGRKMRYLGRDG